MQYMTVRMLTVCIFLCIASAYDLRDQMIPVKIVTAFLAAAFGAGILLPLQSGSGALQEGLTGLLTGAAPGLLLLLLSRIACGSVGEGDGACLLVCGLWTGPWPALEIFMLAAVLAGICSAVCLCIKRMDRRSTIPFLPFMAAAQAFYLCLHFWQILQQ